MSTPRTEGLLKTATEQRGYAEQSTPLEDRVLRCFYKAWKGYELLIWESSSDARPGMSVIIGQATVLDRIGHPVYQLGRAELDFVYDEVIRMVSPEQWVSATIEKIEKGIAELYQSYISKHKAENPLIHFIEKKLFALQNKNMSPTTIILSKDRYRQLRQELAQLQVAKVWAGTDEGLDFLGMRVVLLYEQAENTVMLAGDRMI